MFQTPKRWQFSSLTVPVSGQLTGASDVLVDGTNDDVSFQGGTAGGLPAFAFTTSAGASLASQALLDSDPTTLLGCSSSTICGVWTPYEISATHTSVVGAQNSASSFTDSLSSASFPLFFDFTGFSETWAVWAGVVAPDPGPGLDPDPVSPAPVPEPGTLILMGSGLIGLVGYNLRRRKKSA